VSIIAAVPVKTSFAAREGEEQKKAGTKYPQYPVWLAHLLARFGVASAQGLAGFQALAYDPCVGGNLLLRSAKQHNFFGEYHLMGYFWWENDYAYTYERAEKAFLWQLHYQTRFPNDDDTTHIIAEMLKLTPEQESNIREKFKTWKPEDEPTMQPESCPSDRYAPGD
jgi:hypothetical protein